MVANRINATDFRTGTTITISEPQYNDVYIAAGNVIINAPIYGDLIVTGGSVIINDSIMQDINVIGGTVVISGYVGDDVRCAGGEVTIKNYIKGDLIAAGGKIKIDSNGSAESIIVTGGDVFIDGDSRGDLNVAAGNMKLTGTVWRNADLKGGKILIEGTIAGKANLAASRDIIIYKKARIARGIRYWLPFRRPLEIPSGVSPYPPVYDSLLFITHSRWYFLGASTFLGLLWYLGMAFILILLFQYLFSSTFYRAGIRATAKPGRSILIGSAYFVVIPVTALLILVTIIGLPITVLLLLFYAISIFLAAVISSIVITNVVSFVSQKDFSLMKMVGIELFTFVLLKIISFTPFFGWFLTFIIVSASFGAIISSIRWQSLQQKIRFPSKVRSMAYNS